MVLLFLSESSLLREREREFPNVGGGRKGGGREREREIREASSSNLRLWQEEKGEEKKWRFLCHFLYEVLLHCIFSCCHLSLTTMASGKYVRPSPPRVSVPIAIPILVGLSHVQ